MHLFTQVVGSRAKLEGTLKFVGNNAETATGGALYLQSFGQIQLNEGLKLVFTNNSGKYVKLFYTFMHYYHSEV